MTAAIDSSLLAIFDTLQNAARRIRHSYRQTTRVITAPHVNANWQSTPESVANGFSNDQNVNTRDCSFRVMEAGVKWRESEVYTKSSMSSKVKL